MKQKILIEHNGKTLFKGKIMNMPVKHEKIIEKSIELFDDDDPCIIHTSFIIKHFAEQLISLFDDTDSTTLSDKRTISQLDFLDYESLEGITISLK